MGDMADFIIDRNTNFEDEVMTEWQGDDEEGCTIGCMINTQVGGHHRNCNCPCRVPFTDTSFVTPAEEADRREAGGL